MKKMLHSFKTLKLDASWRPVGVIPSTEALVLCITDRATTLESWDRKIKSASYTFELPSVILLTKFVMKSKRQIRCSRKNIMWRDDHTCQYCGVTGGMLTLDHVIPKSRGGGKVWNNIVACCIRCNQKKGDKLLCDSGMTLLRSPRRPSMRAWLRLNPKAEQQWDKYIL